MVCGHMYILSLGGGGEWGWCAAVMLNFLILLFVLSFVFDSYKCHSYHQRWKVAFQPVLSKRYSRIHPYKASAQAESAFPEEYAKRYRISLSWWLGSLALSEVLCCFVVLLLMLLTLACLEAP